MDVTKKIRFTKEGLRKMKDEYQRLFSERPNAVEHLRKARELGDLSENGYYKASRAKLSSIDHRLFQIKMAIKQAVIVDEVAGSVRAIIGKKIILVDELQRVVEYELVGDLEANPSEGKISLLSPLGKAIENKEIGDNIEYTTPAGKIIYYKILEIY